MKILHGLTGSVATNIALKFWERYDTDSHEVSVVLTETSKNFYHCSETFNHGVYQDEDEWNHYKYHNEVLHIELVKKSDVLVIAPCSANTLAKIANGICDNLLTCVARAWDFKKPFIIAPSMNTNMITHPIYQQHIKTVESWGITVIPPQEKELFCGDYGLGAMANVDDIISRIESK